MADRPITLFVREAGGVGDVVCCTAVVDAYAEAHPERDAWFLTLDVFRGLALLGLGQPNTRVLALPRRVVRGRMHQPVLERLAMYQAASDDPMEFDDAIDLWCPADAHEKATKGRPTESRLDSFFRAAGMTPARPPRFEISEDLRAKAGDFWIEQERESPRILVFPHTAHASKDWPIDRWQAVVDAIGREHFLSPAVKAGSKHRAKLGGVPMVMGLGHVLLAGLIAEADLVLCGDSGPMHVAASCGTLCLALFGPTSGWQMTRYYERALPIQARPADGCHWPCLRYLEQGYARCRDRGVSACLEAIPAEKVIHSVRAAIGSGLVRFGKTHRLEDRRCPTTT